MSRFPTWLPLPLFVVLVLALGLRLPQLNGSFWLDEAAQVLESARPLAQQLDIVPDFQPPLFHLLIHFSLYVSEAEWWLRLVGAVIPGLITIWATYQIGRVWHSTKLGLLAALFLATSSFHIFYSQELRPYALPTMLATLSWWWLLEKPQSLTPTKAQLRFWLGWVSLSLAGWYSSYLYPFVWISQVVFFLVYYRQSWRNVFISGLVTVGGFGLWLPLFLQQLAAGQELQLSLPGWQSVVGFTQLKALPLVAAKFLFGVMNVELNAFFTLTTLVIGGLTFVLLWPWAQKIWRKPQFSVNIGSLLLWLVVPLAVAWLVSFFIPIIQPKRVLFLLPAVYLGISWLILASQPKKLAQCLLIGWLGLNLIATCQYFTYPQYQRENWRDLQQTIAAHYPAAQTIAVFAFPEPFAPWRWYDQHHFETLSLGYINSSNEERVRDQIVTATDTPYVITFDYLGDLTDPDNVIEHELTYLGYQTLEILDYPNIGFVRIWARQGVTVSLFSGTIESAL